MEPTDDPRSFLSLRGLRHALGTIGTGFAVITFCSLGMSSTAGGDRSSLDLGSLVGLAIILVGLRDLKHATRVPELDARRRTLCVIVAVGLCANLLTVVPAVNTAMAIVVAVSEASAIVLVVVLVARTMTVARASDLAARWRTLTIAWLAVASVGAVYGTFIALGAFVDDQNQAWSRVDWATLAISIAYLAAIVWTVVVGNRTIRWLEARAEPVHEHEHERTVPVEPRGGGAPRLGRRGDTLVYYVDPPT